MNELILLFLVAAMFPMWVIGVLFFYHSVIRSGNQPADKSNRIARIRLVWFAMTREELFVDLFPWLKNDELDNVK